MTVYVDDMFRYPMGNFRGMKMSHMIADTEAELHAMVDKIGVSRRWYQDDHYDIALSKRGLAVSHGAVQITLKQCSCMCAVRKITGHLPAPEDAKDEYLKLMEQRNGKGDERTYRIEGRAQSGRRRAHQSYKDDRE